MRPQVLYSTLRDESLFFKKEAPIVPHKLGRDDGIFVSTIFLLSRPLFGVIVFNTMIITKRARTEVCVFKTNDKDFAPSSSFKIFKNGAR